LKVTQRVGRLVPLLGPCGRSCGLRPDFNNMSGQV